MNRAAYVAAVLVALAIVSCIFYLFRVQKLDLGEMGEVSVKYRWGCPSEIRQDIDGDGSVDIVARVNAPFGRFASHTTSPVEDFYDTDFDGNLDTHVVYDKGKAQLLKEDRDGDGDFEVLLRGGEAQEEHQKLIWGFTRIGKEDPTPIAVASLEVTAPHGIVKGSFRLRFAEPVRFYFPERWGLAAAANRWFFVEFASEGSTFHLRPSGAVPKRPYGRDVQELEAGEEIVASLEIGEGAPFSLHSDGGTLLPRLPAGSYLVTARLVIPDYRLARRLDLTSFEVKAGPVELLVGTDNGVEEADPP